MILNTLALDFITQVPVRVTILQTMLFDSVQVDEHLFTTMLNKATQQRVIKYKIEHPLGIEEGDSTDKAVSLLSRSLL